MTTREEEKKLDFENVLKRGRAGELQGNTIITFAQEYERKIFGVDFDIPLGKEFADSMDIRVELEKLSKFLPVAENAQLILIGNLEQKNAFRIRIKGIYLEVKEKSNAGTNT